MLNKFLCQGRVCGEVKTSVTNSGKTIATIDVAINRNYKDHEGKYQADFITFKAFGTTADNMVKYCKKGYLVTIESEINNNNYITKDGDKVYSFDFRIIKIDLFSGNSKKNNGEDEKIEIEEQVIEEHNNDLEIVNDNDLPF